MESLDAESFIYEIQQRPAIWDVGCIDYTNKEKKRNAWEEVVNIFISKEDATVQEKRDFGQKLQHRWRGLRDSYRREIRIQRQSKSGGTERKRPTYVYYHQLSFLDTVAQVQHLPNVLTEDSQPSLSLTPPLLHRSHSPVSKKKKQDPLDERLVTAIEQSFHARQERERKDENDSDRMFLLSLLHPLKQLPEYVRFGVKRKFMVVLEGELQFYGKRQEMHGFHHQARRTDSSDSSIPAYSLLTHPSSSTFISTGTQFSSNQELKCETENKQSFSSAATSPLSDYELFEGK